MVPVNAASHLVLETLLVVLIGEFGGDLQRLVHEGHVGSNLFGLFCVAHLIVIATVATATSVVVIIILFSEHLFYAPVKVPKISFLLLVIAAQLLKPVSVANETNPHRFDPLVLLTQTLDALDAAIERIVASLPLQGLLLIAKTLCIVASILDPLLLVNFIEGSLEGFLNIIDGEQTFQSLFPLFVGRAEPLVLGLLLRHLVLFGRRHILQVLRVAFFLIFGGLDVEEFELPPSVRGRRRGGG